MSSPYIGINPKLISALTGQPPTSIKEKPTASLLPGVITKLIVKHKKKIEPQFESNKQSLICCHCGSKGQYDLGLVALDLECWKKDEEDSAKQLNERNLFEYMQTTGYFRCKQCNGAGKWEFKDPLFGFGFLARVLAGSDEDQSLYMIGQIALYDGSTPRWMTDAEDTFLNKLGENSQDGYLWNRLGNLYFKGGRPELAAAAYEKSIEVDPCQVESYYSLGGLLFQIHELEKSAYHTRMMLVYARHYEMMPTLNLREILAAGLQTLYGIHVTSKKQIGFMPTKEEFAVLDSFKETARGSEPPTLTLVDLEIFPDEPQSFYPLAEMYMGDRREEIPVSERTLDQYLPENRKQIATQAVRHSENHLGSENRPIIAKVRSNERAEKVYQLCDRYEFQCIIGMDFVEDLTDLKKALMQKLSLTNVYAPCPCGSGLKYKFCCANKLKNFDLERFINENERDSELTELRER